MIFTCFFLYCVIEYKKKEREEVGRLIRCSSKISRIYKKTTAFLWPWFLVEAGGVEPDL